MITLLTSGIPSRSHIHFTELDIELACTERSSTSSADASLLKFCRKELRRPLSLLWKPTLGHGYIPPDLLLVLELLGEVEAGAGLTAGPVLAD